MRTEYLLPPDERIERWGRGTWVDEPDEVEWTDEETGLPCLILRNLDLGTFCGYVGVPPAHPWHGIDPDEWADAYRGITFCGLYTELGIVSERPETVLSRARTVTLPGAPDRSYVGHWFFGFDCGHAGDLIPSLRVLLPRLRNQPVLIASRDEVRDEFASPTYKDFVWVRKRVEELALSARIAGPCH